MEKKIKKKFDLLKHLKVKMIVDLLLFSLPFQHFSFNYLLEELEIFRI